MKASVKQKIIKLFSPDTASDSARKNLDHLKRCPKLERCLLSFLSSTPGVMSSPLKQFRCHFCFWTVFNDVL